MIGIGTRNFGGLFVPLAHRHSILSPGSSCNMCAKKFRVLRDCSHHSGMPPAAKRSRTSTAAVQVQVNTQTKVKVADKTIQDDGPWLIVGLGNPGSQYERTKHNIGFMVLDRLAASQGIDMKKLEKSAAVGKGDLAGRKIILAKPVTFMNNSGESVGALSRFYKIPTSRILVVSDDIDLPVGTVRLRAKGGHGGQNGLRSIIQHLGGRNDFPRLKIGIGRPSGSMPVAEYVLTPFKGRDKDEIEFAVVDAVTVIQSILELGLEKTLSGSRV